jgi:RHS repeat-associated protein
MTHRDVALAACNCLMSWCPSPCVSQGSLVPHAWFLSGMHAGQWDPVTELYYLNARYYDPALGRFLQEDAVEGSATLLASQNRYIYCQNNPVSLIDPTGYSPENTGTPSRFGQGNLANQSTATHACMISPHDGFNPHEGNFNLHETTLNNDLRMPRSLSN